jgi:hypothetical protein
MFQQAQNVDFIEQRVFAFFSPKILLFGKGFYGHHFAISIILYFVNLFLREKKYHGAGPTSYFLNRLIVFVKLGLIEQPSKFIYPDSKD